MREIMIILLFVSFTFYLLSGIYIIKKDNKSMTNHSFFLMCIETSIWALGYAFMINSKDIHTANFWRIIASIGWCFIFSSWINFSMYTKYNGNRHVNLKIKFLIYFPPIMFFINSLRYNSKSVLFKTDFGWVDEYPVDVTQVLFMVYFLSSAIIGICMIYLWGKNSTKNREKKQSYVITLTASIVVVLCTLTDMILPMLGVKIFPWAIFILSIAMLGICYSVLKYKMMSITPEFVSDYIFKSVNDPIFFIGEDFIIKNLNEAAESMIGYDCDDLKEKPFSIIKDESCNLDILLEQKLIRSTETNILKKNGELVPCILSARIMYDDFEDILGIVIILHDVSQRKKAEDMLKNYNLELENKIKERTLKLQESNNILTKEITDRKTAEDKIHHMVYHDALTELPNRRYFNTYITGLINFNENTNKNFAVMFLDLDNFKLINDTLGHQKGDILLQKYAKKMKDVTRQDDVFARIGGDEFLFLVNNLEKPGDMSAIDTIYNNIMNIFKQPFIIDGKENFITVSIGVAFYPSDGEDIDTLVKNADTAMYEAKNSGRNNLKVFSSKIKDKLMERTKLRNDLYRALEKDEFQVYYQPQIDIEYDKISGFEALLRWRPNKKHFVSPADFIPLAEDTGLIVSIGYWVIRTACSTLKKWHNNGFEYLNMAINLSANQLNEKNFVDEVVKILREFDLKPESIEFEVTERIALKGTDYIFNAIEELKEMGIKISIDDFGTEYSSFMNIKKIPVDKIKIDMQFVQGVNENDKDAAIVSAIIDLCHNLSLEVIAEGVETKEQLEYLRYKNCDQVQGYFYYKPMPEEEIKELIGDMSF